MVEKELASLKLKELELNALLEITRSINNNLSEAALYKIYHFTLLASFDIKKLALYVFDSEWHCKVNFGTKNDYRNIPLPDHFRQGFDLAEYKLQEQTQFKEFGIVFPVLHKTTLLAVVFIGQLKNEATTNFLEAITNIILVAIENKKLAKRELERESFRKEMEIARQVQQFLFPKNLPKTNQLEIAAAYQPHHEVGGDYYDYIPIDKDQFMVCIADVSGKGVPAALLMSNFQASLRTLLKKTSDLLEIIHYLNDQIRENGNGEIFITFFGAIYNTNTHTLRYVNCGHNPSVLYIPETQQTSLLEVGTTVLGMFNPLPFISMEELNNLSNFSLFNYTDGITETQNADNEEFGIQRYIDLVTMHQNKEISVFNDTVIEELTKFKGEKTFKDDLTLLSCKMSFS
jgi:sigma-B regulation protein RsbU (phosphoserine phosphatase)